MTVLRKRRLELGYTQEEVAKLLGISTGFYAQVERMENSLHKSLWLSLGRILSLKSSKLYIEIDGDYFARERIHDD